MAKLTTYMQLEEQRLNVIQGSIHIKHFCTHLTHWELLILIHKLNGDPKYGLNDYIDRLQTLSQTRLTIQTFIKQAINLGLFEVVPSEKKSRKTLKLSPPLAAELEGVLVQLWNHQATCKTQGEVIVEAQTEVRCP